MKKIFSWMMLLVSMVLFSQTFTVSGRVNDFHNNTEIKNAQIRLGTYSTFSDEQGNFSFTAIPKGGYTLKVSHPDCDDFIQKISVDKNIEVSLRLEHHLREIEGVNLKTPHKNTGSIIIKSLDQSFMERNATENLGNLLQNVSGVSALKTGNNIAKPIIHGLHSSRIAVFTNGVRLAEQEWGVEHAPNVDVQTADHVDVIKGASALKYGGDAIGGVVVLEPEVFKKVDTLKGRAMLSGLSNGRGIDFGMNAVKTWNNFWAIKTTGSYKKSGDMQAPHYGLMNTGLEAKAFSLTVQKNEFKQGIEMQYSIIDQEIGILRSSHTGNLTDFLTSVNADNPLYQRNFTYAIDQPKQQIRHQIFKLSGYKRLENLGKISVNYNWQNNHRLEYDARRADLAGLPSVDLSLITNQLNVNHLIERGKWNWESGIDAVYQNNYSDPQTKARRLIPNYNKYAVGGYTVFKYDFSPKLQFEAGARYDYQYMDVVKWLDEEDWLENYAEDFSHFFVENVEGRIKTKPQLRFNNFSYNAGLHWKPNEVHHFKFNYSRNSRTPNVAELFAEGLHHSASVIEEGNIRLMNEQTQQLNLTWEGNFKAWNGIQVSVNPYYLYSKNFINQIPTGVQNTIRGVFPVWSYQQIEARMWGVDADVQVKLLPELSLKTFGSYLYGQDLTNNEPLILMAPARMVNRLEYRNERLNSFFFAVQHENVFRQNRFPIHNAEVTDYVGGLEVVETVDLSTPPAAYHLWSLQTGIQVVKNFSAEFSVQNIFNTEYRDYLNRMRFFASEMGRNFILTLKYNF